MTTWLATMLIGLTGAAGGHDALHYAFDFGNRLELSDAPLRVNLVVTNTADEAVDCGAVIITIPDLDRRGVDIIAAPDNSCLGGGCLADFSPPLNFRVFDSITSFAPGETKTCPYLITRIDEDPRPIQLSGTGGPITIVRPAMPVSVLSRPAKALLVATLMFVAMIAARRQLVGWR